MSSFTVVKQSPIIRTSRVMQCEGMFDIAASKFSSERWDVQLDLPDSWNIGVIVGPSGSGKTTIARELYGDRMVERWDWPEDKSILDAFPAHMSITEITDLLSHIGFNSVPAWLRPFHVLSQGEQFRVHIARTLAEYPDLVVLDEFTSVVDRTVAQIGSASVAKAIRRRNTKLVAVSCHYDILDWLEPDWVYEPHTNTLHRGRLWRRPSVTIEIKRVHPSAWQLFRKHHYLAASHNDSARSFVAFYNGQPIGFSSWLSLVSGTLLNAMRNHRTVILPDYQGLGLGTRLMNYLASAWRGVGKRAFLTTSHPAFVAWANRSSDWRVVRKPSFTSPDGDSNRVKVRAITRLTAGLEYVGPAMPTEEAVALLGVSAPVTRSSATVNRTVSTRR